MVKKRWLKVKIKNLKRMQYLKGLFICPPKIKYFSNYFFPEAIILTMWNTADIFEYFLI